LLALEPGWVTSGQDNALLFRSREVLIMKRTGMFLVVAALAATAHAAAVEPKADALLRSMSELLAKTQTLRFTTDEHHERLRRSGERVNLDFFARGHGAQARRSALRHQERRKIGIAGLRRQEDQLRGQREKVWAQTAVPPTIDQAMDYIGTRLGIPMPMADILYSSPYDALVGDGTTGKYVGVEKIAGKLVPPPLVPGQGRRLRRVGARWRASPALPDRAALQARRRRAGVAHHVQRF
jgi:hypothetical protein